MTPGIPEDALWLITAHDRESYRLEMIKVIPGVVVGTIKICLIADGEDAADAAITYSYTSLSDHGDRALEEFTEAHFKSFMKVWEKELNYFLRTGKMLDSGSPGGDA